MWLTWGLNTIAKFTVMGFCYGRNFCESLYRIEQCNVFNPSCAQWAFAVSPWVRKCDEKGNFMGEEVYPEVPLFEVTGIWWFNSLYLGQCFTMLHLRTWGACPSTWSACPRPIAYICMSIEEICMSIEEQLNPSRASNKSWEFNESLWESQRDLFDSAAFI